MPPGSGTKTRRAAAVVLLVSVAACGHLSAPRWPWHHSPAAPTPVHELDITGAGADTFPQYWKRNTLLVDLSAARGSGSITLRPGTAGWPVRVAFRVTPGAIGVLEALGAQRQTLPITATGSTPIDLELAPGVYTAASEQMTVSWGPGVTPSS
jgi:hypothetical protein